MQYSAWSDPQKGWYIVRYQIFRRDEKPVANEPVATFPTLRAASLECKHLEYDASVIDVSRLASGESKVYQNWQCEVIFPPIA